MWSAPPAPSSLRRRAPVSRLSTSYGNSVCQEPSQDQIHAFFARYKLVVCMNLFALFFLCICSGFFNGSSSSSRSNDTGLGSRGLDETTQSYSSYMDYKAETSMRASSAASGRLRGLSRRDKGESLWKGSSSSTSSSSSWVSSTHVPQRHPPRFVPGTLPQSDDKPGAATHGAASQTASQRAAASKHGKQGTASTSGTIIGSSKKKALLNTLVSSTKSNGELLMASMDALDEIATAPVMTDNVLENPVDADAGMLPILNAKEDDVPVQCAFSEEGEGEEVMPSLHDDLVRGAEWASEQNIRAPATKIGEDEYTTQTDVSMAALGGTTSAHAGSPALSLCSYTPSEAGDGPAVEMPEVGVSVSLNPEYLDVEEKEMEAPGMEVETIEVERLDENLQQLEEDMVALPVPQDQHHPFEYIPPFAREDVFC